MTAYGGSGLDGSQTGSVSSSHPESHHPPAGIEPAEAATVAFVGRTLKGPLNEPVMVGDFARFQQVFGGLWTGSLLPHAVEQYFEHGGRRNEVRYTPGESNTDMFGGRSGRFVRNQSMRLRKPG